MEPNSIYKKLNKVLTPLTVALALIVVMVATLGTGITVRAMQQKQVSAWRQSLPVSLLSHFIASDSVPIKNVAMMALGTGLFDGIKVMTPSGMTLVEIGRLSSDAEELEVKDESGGKWGSIFISVNDDAWMGPTLYLAAFLGAGLLILLLIVFLLSRFVLKREFSILDQCIEEIEAFSEEMISYQGSGPSSNKDAHNGTITKDRFSSREQKRMTLLVNRLVREVTTLALGIRNSEREKGEVQARAKTTEAIAQMTQMLAHDVRKPFSMLKTGLNLLQATSADPNKFKKNLAFLVSEVDRATRSVDGMLTDVMEIGSTSTELIQEPAAPEALIESTLGEIFRVYPKSKIAIAYDLQHSSMVNVHLKKVSRIFSNIVGNAVQAINESGNLAGTLWFKTKTDGDFVQFCIGNSGSMIPPESLAKLFEAFFTSGKKGGTGLGLAIAQKVVQAHGGKIWCESSKSAEYPEGKVEFFFTLPVAAGIELVTTAQLPKHSDDITQMIALLSQASHSKSDSEFNKSDGLLHQEVIQRIKALPRPLGLLIVDDESIYRSALAGWVEESPELAQFCRIYHANGSGEAFETLKNQSLKNQSIDLIITDIDMGPKSLSGFDLVKELRTNHDFKGQIFVHSNRIVPDDHRRAGDLGADGFLPKPMAKGQLFRLILQTIYSLHPTQEAPEAVLTLEPAAVPSDAMSPYDLIAVIDDEDIFRDQWPAFLQGFKTICYPTAEDFVKDWDRVSGSLVAVLTDKYLGAGLDGIKLGTMLRQKAPDLALILSTSDLSVQDTSNIFDLIVDKDAFEEAPKITQYLLNKIQEEGLPSTMRKTIRSFDAQVRQLGELSDNQSNLNPSSIISVIDSHLKSWGPLLKDWGEWDESAKERIKNAMSATDLDRLKHDIKGSITRVKILLRNLESGDMDRSGVASSLRSRAEDLGRL